MSLGLVMLKSRWSVGLDWCVCQVGDLMAELKEKAVARKKATREKEIRRRKVRGRREGREEGGSAAAAPEQQQQGMQVKSRSLGG